MRQKKYVSRSLLKGISYPMTYLGLVQFLNIREPHFCRRGWHLLIRFRTKSHLRLYKCNLIRKKSPNCNLESQNCRNKITLNWNSMQSGFSRSMKWLWNKITKILRPKSTIVRNRKTSETEIAIGIKLSKVVSGRLQHDWKKPRASVCNTIERNRCKSRLEKKIVGGRPNCCNRPDAIWNPCLSGCNWLRGSRFGI